ncbi:uncharacterized protein LOC134440965 [Engraulis encrasicolus]|uniref:uncharacterized protein LOC134440965 n=1 Tax=Engraulis encrasicolus TaxID=184585 RepID=UPI002FD22410
MALKKDWANKVCHLSVELMKMQRKGKLKPLNIIEKDDTDLFVKFLISLGNRSSHVDIETASEFVCRIYGQRKTRDTNEARYLKLMEMSGNISKESPLANVKRVDCALLPPSRRALEMHVLRARYVSIVWTLATLPCPTDGLSVTDYGWCVKDGLLQPNWFNGPSIPQHLFSAGTESHSQEDSTEEESDEPWSEESEDSDQED